MADKEQEKFSPIANQGAMRLNSMATQNARIDRVFVETHIIPAAGGRPPHPTSALKTLGFEIGQAHPKNEHAYLVGAELTGMNDRQERWQTLWQTDVQAFAIAAGLGSTSTWPNLLSRDGYQKSDEWGTEGTVIVWQFDVVNPESYIEPSLTTAHPLVPTAVLVAQNIGRGGIKGRVYRRYQKLPELVDWEFDPETRDRVKLTRQIVATTLAPATPAAGTDVSQRALGTTFSLRSTRTINGGSLPTAYQRTRLLSYTFPRLLTGVDVILGLNGDSWFWPKYRAAYTKQVSARVAVDYHTATPPASTLFQPKPNDFNYPGVLFAFSAMGLINDQLQLSKSVGDTVESITIPASTPSYSAYLAMIGQEQLVAESVIEWRYRLFRRMRIYVTME